MEFLTLNGLLIVRRTIHKSLNLALYSAQLITFLTLFIVTVCSIVFLVCL